MADLRLAPTLWPSCLQLLVPGPASEPSVLWG